MLSRPHDTQAKTECPDHTHRAERVTHSPSFISAISPTPPFQALSIIPSDSCQSIPLTAIILTPQWMQTAKSPDPSVTPTDPHARSRESTSTGVWWYACFHTHKSISQSSGPP